MVLRYGILSFCAMLMLAVAWAPVAFIANGGGVDDAPGWVTSIFVLDDEGTSVLPAARMNAAIYLDPQQVPVLEPTPFEPDVSPAAMVDSRDGTVEFAWDDPPPRPAVPLSERPYARLVQQAADRHGVDPGLVHALIEVESSYRADAISAAGAMGLMQLMPLTAKRYGVADPLDPASNIDAGTRHLRSLLDEFGPLYALDALAAYHAGEPVVRRHGGIPPYPQTHGFVRRVLDVLLSQTRWRGGD